MIRMCAHRTSTLHVCLCPICHGLCGLRAHRSLRALQPKHRTHISPDAPPGDSGGWERGVGATRSATACGQWGEAHLRVHSMTRAPLSSPQRVGTNGASPHMQHTPSLYNHPAALSRAPPRVRSPASRPATVLTAEGRADELSAHIAAAAAVWWWWSSVGAVQRHPWPSSRVVAAPARLTWRSSRGTPSRPRGAPSACRGRT
jgi:hypothetical protein